MDSWTHHGYVGDEMNLGASHPHSVLPLGPPYRRGKAHTIVGVTRRGGVARRPNSTKTPQTFGHANKHKMEQSYALI